MGKEIEIMRCDLFIELENCSRWNPQKRNLLGGRAFPARNEEFVLRSLEGSVGGAVRGEFQIGVSFLGWRGKGTASMERSVNKGSRTSWS